MAWTRTCRYMSPRRDATRQAYRKLRFVIDINGISLKFYSVDMRHSEAINYVIVTMNIMLGTLREGES